MGAWTAQSKGNIVERVMGWLTESRRNAIR
jgi:hypothetical protein